MTINAEAAGTGGRSGPGLALGLSALGHAYSHLTMLLYATVVLVLAREWQVPYDDLAWLSIPAYVLFGLGALPAGWLGDRWSSAGMMAVFFFGVGGGCIVAGLATGPMGLLAGLALIGLFGSIYHPVGIAWLARQARNTGRAFGINGVFGSLGTAGAAATAGVLADLWGWRAAFLVPGAVILATGAVFVALMASGHIRDGQALAKPAAAAPSRADVRRAFWVLTVTMIMGGLIFQSVSVGLPKLFEERQVGALLGGATGVGLMVSLVYALSAVAQVVGGELSDRHSLRLVYFLAQLLQVPVALLAAGLGGPGLVAAATVMVSLNAASTPAENALLARYTPERWRGRAFGVKFLLTLGVSSVGVSLAPLLYARFGTLDALLVVVAAFAAVAAVFAVLLPADRRQPRALPMVSPAE
ncbi:MFS transporter [Zavarzinia sp. CC-PAN008]|uniref:MFS transporter n=1 Tax=Zavarzinia sp. CC-PAN008 TaxID=3243332 RepID=UPI003F7449AA